MISADLHEGDILFVRRDLEAREGDLVAVFVEGGESKLGRLIKNRKTQSILFQTQSYKPVLYDFFEIQGIVVYVIKQLGQLSAK